MNMDCCSNTDSSTYPDLIYWIWLTELSGIGPVTQKELLIIFGNPQEIYCANREQLVKCKGIGHYRLSILLESKDLQTAKEILKLCEANDINIMTLANACFPEKCIFMFISS
jgi:DNA processing protein